MLDFFERVPIDYLSDAEFSAVEGAERSFMNINTPEDRRRRDEDHLGGRARATGRARRWCCRRFSAPSRGSWR